MSRTSVRLVTCASAALIASAACGRIWFEPANGDADANADDMGGPDAPPPLTCTWQPPERLPEAVQSSSQDWEPTLSPDGRTLIFASDRSGVSRLYRTVRVDATWSPPALVAAAGTSEHGPDFNATGDRLYFIGDADGYGVYTAPVSGGELGAAVLTSEAGFEALAPAIASDELEVFYTGFGLLPDLQRATRSSTSATWTSTGPVVELSTAALEGWPSLTNDDLTIYFESAEPGPSVDLYRATRPARDQSFGPATPVSELNVADADDSDPGVRRDGREIIFASDRPGGAGATDLYRSVCE